MTAVAVWLLVLGSIDLFRAHHDVTSRARRLVLAGLAGWSVVALGAAAAPTGRGIAAWAVVGVAAVVWVLASGSALGRATRPPTAGQGPGRVVRRRVVVAYAALAAGTLAALLGGRATGGYAAVATLLEGTALARFPPERVLLVIGVLLVQVSTANLVVRLLLDLVGVPAHDNEKQLRGGRVLGPMERLLLTGLGIAGSLGAASVVIAAKALLRFPELRTPARGEAPTGGPSDVTEYFLLGSTASWLVALGGVALVALA